MTDHAEHVAEYYDAVDDERIDDLLALFADDVVYDRPGQPPIEGKVDLEAFYREGRPLEDGSHTVHDVLVDGDRAAVRGTFSGVQDGDDVEFGFADVHVFEDGVIAKRYTYTDRDTV
ncbi:MULTISPECIES: nuclear transport factor 2 family protein [Halobacterium]|uniref:nuclear transport factor 2 family protein n=1 Tax=Halobacterium TaxID=2239 RepID=UPI0009EAE1F6|nr:nuclear transport factor 2 family protein [Halobacterium sp. CBA1132]MCG1002396.1 nuclear transport factor 2 family protein [Halobacterium noricense]